MPIGITLTAKAATAISRATKLVANHDALAAFYVVQPTPDTCAVAVVGYNGMVALIDVECSTASYVEPFAIPAATVEGAGARAIHVDGSTVTVWRDGVSVTYTLPEPHERATEFVDAIASTVAAGRCEGEAELHTVPAATLAAVVATASTDYARPTLTNVYRDGDTIVATDSYRLAFAPVAGEGSGYLSAAVIAFALTAKAGAYLTRFASNGERAYIGGGGVAVLYRHHALGNSYPNWRQLVPALDGMQPLVTVASGAKAAKIITATAKAAKVTVKTGSGSPLRFAADSVTILTNGDTYTVAAGTFTPGAWYGNAFSGAVVAFNPAFVASALDTFDGATTVYVTDANRPALFTGYGSNVTVLLMPVRVPA